MSVFRSIIEALFGYSSNRKQTKVARKAESARRIKERDIWIPQNENIIVAGRNIGGMIYSGYREAKKWEGQGDPVIDKTLPVARVGTRAGDRDLQPPLSYSTIDPKQRAAYLNWLSSSRSQKQDSAGYILLYFYGLEHRFFQDSPSDKEKRILTTEVERLLEVYGDDFLQVRRYLSIFLSFVSALMNPTLSIPPRFVVKSNQIPLDICVAIGQRLKDGQSLNSDWSLSWYSAHPETKFRTPATRANREFRELFKQIFEKKFPEGLKLRPPQIYLSPIYKAASGAFSVDLEDHFKRIPDITRLSAPINNIRDIVDEATESLDSYSRFLGRNPHGRDTIEAHALLPESLWSIFPNPAMENLRNWAEGQIESDGLVPVEELLERINGALPEKIYKRHLVKIVDALARVSVGMAPDPKFALRSPKLGDPVVLFRLPHATPSTGDVSEQYREALLYITVGGFIACADDSMEEMERAGLQEYINSRPISDTERIRLLANLRWIFCVPPDFSTLYIRLKELSEDTRYEIGKIALRTAALDGLIQPAEIKAIKRLYKAIDLPQDNIYSDLHSLSVPGEPKTILLPTEKEEQGYTIPPPENQPLSLDMKRVTDTLRETEEVSELIGSIFSDDEEEDIFDEKSSHTGNEGDIFEGLKVGYTDFLEHLLKQVRWNKSEYTHLATRFELMPEGAIEIINEWSYERFDESLIEEYEDEEYEINQEIVDKIFQ